MQVLGEEAKRFLAHKGYNPLYGAWPLKRILQREIQDPLADMNDPFKGR
ncbi:hypothetical protein H707_01253, partial [Bartonella bacilliformis Hosp800-02]